MGSSKFKTCSKCEQSKRVEEFAIKTATSRQAWCKACQRRWAKDHYANNKAAYLIRNAHATQRKREYVHELRQRPCTDCGQSFPFYVMEFDHVEPKRSAISKLCSQSWRRLREELARCELVCANCHAVRTWKRRQRVADPRPS